MTRSVDRGKSDTMHISFLLHNAYGIGGTIRTTFTLARTLAERHDVEIVSGGCPAPGSRPGRTPTCAPGPLRAGTG
ncbi:hypothetical protein SCALM49S_06310 [Streptomyces californicus]